MKAERFHLAPLLYITCMLWNMLYQSCFRIFHLFNPKVELCFWTRTFLSLPSQLPLLSFRTLCELAYPLSKHRHSYTSL